MPERLRSVNGDRHFAWLEFQDRRDGIAFAAAIEGAGWKNLLRELRETRNAAGQTVFEDDTRALQVRLFKSTSGREQGVLWIPDDPDESDRRWIQRPGAISSPRHALVSGDEAGARWADLLVLSGHGSKGKVYGTSYAELVREPEGDERSWNVAGLLRDRTSPRGRRLKYLLLPCCTNAGPAVAPMWLEAFRDRPADEVLHGILGYAQMYPGDEVGANVMRRFVDLLFPPLVSGRPPRDEKTILQCWAEANRGLAWGAVMLEEAALGDRMSQWISPEGLPDPREIKVKQYDEYTTEFPRPLDASHGIAITDAAPAHEARFWVSKRGDEQTNLQEVDGFVFGWDGHDRVQVGNNDNWIDPQLGLDPGRAGKLVLSAASGRFEAGTTMTVVFYLYRETHEGMDLRTLLALDLSPSQRRRLRPLADANQRKPDRGRGRIDAFHYTFDDADDEARWELAHGRAEILFRVPPDAPDANRDRSTAHSCGYFWVDVVPPRALPGDPAASPPADMPQSPGDRSGLRRYLEAAIHLVRHGVHLHRHRDDAALERRDVAEGPAAVAALRRDYEARMGIGVA
jgi:hypothetical protein